jgi:hypothetical protein
MQRNPYYGLDDLMLGVMFVVVYACLSRLKLNFDTYSLEMKINLSLLFKIFGYGWSPFVPKLNWTVVLYYYK